MGLGTVLAVLPEAGSLLEGLHGGFGPAAEAAVHGQRSVETVEQRLQRPDVRAGGAAAEEPAAQGDRRGAGGGRRGGPVVDEWEGEPVRPAAAGDRGPDAAVTEAAPFHGPAVPDVVAHVPGPVQRQAGDLRQRADRSPGRALLFGPGKQAVRALVRAAVRAVAAGNAAVRADGLHGAEAAARPGVALAGADAVGHDLPGGDVLIVPGGAPGTVVGRVLRGLPAEQAAASLVDAAAVPVGAPLFRHGQAPAGEMLAGERGVDPVGHGDAPQGVGDGGTSPSPG